MTTPQELEIKLVAATDGVSRTVDTGVTLLARSVTSDRRRRAPMATPAGPSASCRDVSPAGQPRTPPRPCRRFFGQPIVTSVRPGPCSRRVDRRWQDGE